MEVVVQVALIGQPVDLTYDYTHLGESAKDIKAAASSPFLKDMAASQRPMVVVGPGVLQRSDSKAVLREIYDLCGTAGVSTCLDECCHADTPEYACPASVHYVSMHCYRSSCHKRLQLSCSVCCWLALCA